MTPVSSKNPSAFILISDYNPINLLLLFIFLWEIIKFPS